MTRPIDRPGGRPLPPYRAPWWLPGGHLQTIYPYFAARPAQCVFRRERWSTNDGDFIDLDWLQEEAGGSRLVVLFHGLEGCSRSHYAVSLMEELRSWGWRGVVPHFRGCSGESNVLPRAYHSGDSAEVDWVLRRLQASHPSAKIHVVGISLGGNVLLKWLGEQGAGAGAVAASAVAVSAPVDLTTAAGAMDGGWNKLLYTRHFLRTMKKKMLDKIRVHGMTLDAKAVRSASTFREIDNLYTAPIHGFRNAQHYWLAASSKPWLNRIQIPTLLINALNDPFLPAAALPDQNQVSSTVTLEYPETGGHVGFVSGRFPGHLGWLSRRIIHFFADTA